MQAVLVRIASLFRGRLASLMKKNMLTEQLIPCNVWYSSMQNQVRKRARRANTLQGVRLTHSTVEVFESKWREGVSMLQFQVDCWRHRLRAGNNAIKH